MLLDLLTYHGRLHCITHLFFKFLLPSCPSSSSILFFISFPTFLFLLVFTLSSSFCSSSSLSNSSSSVSVHISPRYTTDTHAVVDKMNMFGEKNHIQAKQKHATLQILKY
uniref:Uncharacterized protein n=1 Tax=Cacopsylla melanoneura TaxID=428564 RepID=A0A8D8X6L6_9HEMI